jgi:hypothetical protein
VWANEAKIYLKLKLFFAKNKEGKTALRLVEGNEHIRQTKRVKAIQVTYKCHNATSRRH